MHNREIENKELPEKIMLNVHPQRWNDRFVPWARELVMQNVKNVVKRALIKRKNAGERIIGDGRKRSREDGRPLRYEDGRINEKI